MSRTDEMWVVETDDGKAFVGQIDQRETEVVIYSGYRGHPKAVEHSCITLLKPAKQHPDVITIARGRRT